MQQSPYVNRPTLYRGCPALTILAQRAQHKFGPVLITITVGLSSILYPTSQSRTSQAKYQPKQMKPKANLAANASTARTTPKQRLQTTAIRSPIKKLIMVYPLPCRNPLGFGAKLLFVFQLYNTGKDVCPFGNCNPARAAMVADQHWHRVETVAGTLLLRRAGYCNPCSYMGTLLSKP